MEYVTKKKVLKDDTHTQEEMEQSSRQQKARAIQSIISSESFIATTLILDEEGVSKQEVIMGLGVLKDDKNFMDIYRMLHNLSTSIHSVMEDLERAEQNDEHSETDSGGKPRHH